MILQTTADLRTAMVALFHDVEAGQISNSTARARVLVAKVIIDTLKVEIAAANLGRQFSAVSFDETERIADHEKKIKRIA